jgi:hypothetical protein
MVLEHCGSVIDILFLDGATFIRLEALAVMQIVCNSIAPGTTLPEGESYILCRHLEICHISALAREGSRCYREPVVVGICY